MNDVVRTRERERWKDAKSGEEKMLDTVRNALCAKNVGDGQGETYKVLMDFEKRRFFTTTVPNKQ